MPASFPNESAAAFVRARDFLAKHRTDYTEAVAQFQWPQLDSFNWPLDYFDKYADGNPATALEIVEEGGRQRGCSFAHLWLRASQGANFLRRCAPRRGDCPLLTRGTEGASWEALRACM